MRTVVLTPVMRARQWRVRMRWLKKTRYFGKFAPQAEAEKWIEAHRSLATRPQEPPRKRPYLPEAVDDRC